MRKILKILPGLLVLFSILLWSNPVLAKQDGDWYIKDFQSEITVNQDSSLLITERITADCPNCLDKHGIFRTLPLVYYPEKNQKVITPIKLVRITDFKGKALKYQTSKDWKNQTVSYKIGDPDITVEGENYYQITYLVKNVIRFNNQTFDELYWNLNGNFWELGTDHYQAKINFPENIDQATVQEINLYSGEFGSSANDLASFKWESPNSLFVQAKESLAPYQGITLSATFPKNIITPYRPTFKEKYTQFSFFLLPLIIFFFCFFLWNRFGRDPSLNPTVVPEFSPPEGYGPLELGVIYSDGQLKSDYISAAIIGLAVKGFLKIEEIDGQGIFNKKDYLLRLTTPKKSLAKSPAEDELITKLFANFDQIELSSLKYKFYHEIPNLRKTLVNTLAQEDLIVKSSRPLKIGFLFVSGFLIALSFQVFSVNPYFGLSIFLSSLIIGFFAFVMSRRSLKGANLNQKILGFKLYLETAEKYRQRFNEKENIFERFLPYAIMFGLTKLWISKIKEIYGEEYFIRYYPVWYLGSFSSFSSDSFNTAINSLSSTMASTLASSPSGSGSGGGGFSGGGGGGGGGGGW